MKRNLLLLSLAIILAAGCSKDPDPVVPEDAGIDVAPIDDVVEDIRVDAEPDVHVEPDTPVVVEPGSRVALDLAPYLADAPDPNGSVQVFEVTDPADLIEGASATGRVGDYILQNDRVRFVVDADVRRMNMCPWGGNIIDAEYLSDGSGGDILDAICLLLNADQTFRPETYEILHDGSNGAGVLAVTGSTEIFDRINITTLIADLDPTLVDSFVLKPDGLMPLTITKYYILRPGDQGARIFTMIRNDGDERHDVVVSHLMGSGGDGGFFNPLGSLGGFGYETLGLANPDPDKLSFLAYIGADSAVAYMPRPDARLGGDLPISGAYLTIEGSAASVLGRTDIITTLLASRDELATMPGILHLEPGGVGEVEHWTYAGDGALSTMADVMYEELGAPTGSIDGTVRDSGGDLVVGARVTAVDSQGRTMNQTLTRADGTYEMRLPSGAYTVHARLAEQPTLSPQSVDVATGESATVGELVIELPAKVSVTVRTPDGDPTPARVTLICEGPCPNKATSNEREMAFDGLPGEFATVAWVGVSGDLEFGVPAGTYRAVVSRGLEWSLWPPDARTTGGELIEVVAGQSVEIDAEIARVIDTTGALSGDFHVHALASEDSTVPHEDRVLTFLVEGVNVMVSSDHDVISDFGPAVEALGAQAHLVTLIGNEVSTADIGHINGFPLTRDTEHRGGGALDWGGGAGLALPPSEVFEWIREFPGEQVVQINHPDSSFLSFSDVLRGVSYGDTTAMRIKAPEVDPDTGDTGLWSDDFTAMELMNGFNQGRFWAVARWWLTLIGRGHMVAGTAVTDTHARYRDILGGVPRSYVFVDEDKDSIADFDTAHFVEAINSQQVIGTNGPFVRVMATNGQGATAGLGEVLATDGDTVTFEVIVEVPEWIAVNRIQMYMNSDEVLTDPGQYNPDPIPATKTVDFELTEDDLEVISQGTHEHRRYRKVVEIEVDTDVDAYVVFIVRGPGDMYPVVPQRSVRPFAFTNPVYLDADGGGYDNPHLAEVAQTAPPEPTLLRRAPAGEPRDVSREEVLQIIHDLQCRH